MEKVSIIVPIYNCGNVIEKCVNSIVNQTYTELEILLIDDGSKDDSGEKCDLFAQKDNRIRAVHQKNGGVSSARNTGIQSATGRYVMFVDSDDYLNENYVETMVDSIEKNDVDIIISGYIMLKQAEKINHTMDEKIWWNKKEFLEDFEELFQKYFLHVVWNKIFKREKIEKYFDESLSLGEDCLFVLDYMSNIENIGMISECGYNYKMDQENSLTNKYRDNQFEIATILYEREKEFIDKIGKNKGADNAIQYIFLDNVSRCIKEICKDTNLSKCERDKNLLKISNNSAFLQARKECKGLGKGQKINFALLSRKKIGLVRFIEKVRG